MKRGRTILRHAIATLVAFIALSAGVAMLLGWLIIDRPLPPLQSSVYAHATVVGSRVQPGEWTRGKFPQKSFDSYFVAVSFPVEGGGTQSNELQVAKSIFDTQPVGSTITVWYFPDRPNINVIGNPMGLVDKRSRYGELFGWVLVIVGVWGAVVQGNKWYMAHGGQSVL